MAWNFKRGTFASVNNLATSAEVIGKVAEGTAVLVAGAVTVTDPKITANSHILLAHDALAGTRGALFIDAKTAGTSFGIKSTSATDTSTVKYWIVKY